MAFRLAIVITHPIQYYAPLFQLLAQQPELQLRVFYTWSQAQKEKFDIGFKRMVEWDIPLLEGYDYCFVPNTAKRPGVHHFMGIQNPDLIHQIVRWKADALWVNGWNFYSHLQVMRYFKGKIPVYFRGDSTLLDERAGLRRFLRRRVLRWVYRHVDYALYVGKQNKAYFLAHGLQPHQLIFAPHAVDNKRFMCDEEEHNQQAQQWRREMGIPDDAFVFLFAGKFEPKKNPFILLDAFLTAGAVLTAGKVQGLSGREAHLLYVGNGILEDELKQRVQAFPQLACRVHFLPFQNQSLMPVVYRLGQVLVLPSSYQETWGLAVNEAMACGRPVIVSDRVGCAVDLVMEGKTGWIFPAGDVYALRELMEQVLYVYRQHPERWSQMKKACQDHILQYAMEKIVTNFIDHVRSSGLLLRAPGH